MVRAHIFVVATLFGFSAAAPIAKRIAQTIAESTADWEQACIAAGGADQCNPISQTAFSSLLAAGGNCDQQDAADQMVDLAKTLGNDAEMIRLAQLFVQQPRNAPDSLQVPYCQTAPKNQELNGLFHCQFAGSDFTTFSGDQTGNVPLGLNEVNPAGSCPAKTDGPVPDGVQLNTLTTDPGAGGVNNTGDESTEDDDGTVDDDNECTDDTGANNGSGATVTVTVTAAPTATAAPSTGTVPSTGSTNTTVSDPAPSSSSSTDFQRQNGLDAKALNDEFPNISADDACTDGEQACVEGGFAQCVGGAWSIQQCSGGTQCFALPLVNKAGTSLACTTQEDADSRIANTGA